MLIAALGGRGRDEVILLVTDEWISRRNQKRKTCTACGWSRLSWHSRACRSYHKSKRLVFSSVTTKKRSASNFNPNLISSFALSAALRRRHVRTKQEVMFLCEKKNNISPGSFGEIFPATISPTEEEKSLNYAWRAREIIFHHFSIWRWALLSALGLQCLLISPTIGREILKIIWHNSESLSRKFLCCRFRLNLNGIGLDLGMDFLFFLLFLLPFSALMCVSFMYTIHNCMIDGEDIIACHHK